MCTLPALKHCFLEQTGILLKPKLLKLGPLGFVGWLLPSEEGPGYDETNPVNVHGECVHTDIHRKHVLQRSTSTAYAKGSYLEELRGCA